MKSISRILLIVFVMTMMMTFVLSIGTVVYATDFSPGKINNQAVTIGTAENGIRQILGAVFRYIQIGGSIVAVGILAIFGIQWFTASVQKKVELKEKLVSYLIGALITFGAATIMGWMANMINTVTGP